MERDIWNFNTRFKADLSEERPTLAKLRNHLHEQTVTLRSAEIIMKQANFTTNPFQFTKNLERALRMAGVSKIES